MLIFSTVIQRSEPAYMNWKLAIDEDKADKSVPACLQDDAE